MRAPIYQNATQIIFSVVYLALYTGAINTVNPTGDLDATEVFLYIFTFGFLADEFSKFWKVGRNYLGFWNVFNLALYALLATSLVTRIMALSHPFDDHKHHDGPRERLNKLSYNFLGKWTVLPFSFGFGTDVTSILRSYVLDETSSIPRLRSILRCYVGCAKSHDEGISDFLLSAHCHYRRFPSSFHRYGQCGFQR